MCNGKPAPPTTTQSPTISTTSSTKKLLEVTNEELRSHNNPSNAWCAVHGKVLSISDFAKRHPGGDVILLASGRDATVLFETYHPRGVSEKLVEKLQIGVMKEGEIPSSYYSWDSEFYRTLRTRVVARLDELHLSRRGSMEIWIKALFLLTWFWYSLYKMYTSSFSTALLWTISMGTAAAFVGTCIQHDGNHGAFAEQKWLNKLAGWTQDMIGASAFTWEFQHMLGHHPYTNLLDEEEDLKKEKGVDCPMVEKDQESDPDVFSSFPIMRMHPLHEPSWYHRYQHLYAPLLFALMTLAKVFQQDYEVAMSKRLYHIDATCRYGSKLNLIRFWFMKIITSGYMIALPCYFHGIARGLGLFVLGHMTCGELLATMFIVNHVIEGVSYAKKNVEDDVPTTTAASPAAEEKKQEEDEKIAETKEVDTTIHPPSTMYGQTPMKQTRSDAVAKSTDGKIPHVPYNDWAAVQCQTSVNWSPGSWFWNHFSGGLSHQIEHHLFPSICHTNYCYIQDVVEKTCVEFGVPYQSEPNLFVAYKKMLAHLKFLGNEKVKAS
mmetsp:Transcript_11403/g.15797  ORF Transcript_11403/g.15797 Transcript_11403/m.15797 type:complete len:548 (-) Transcript_11403:456-2099(-)|eukprot:CAMPEP_0185728432 /NCGR_PEP_ID=MMETSP1171-20130828/3769_1 /TAXON_ID=374046 /ORGANISM="Helicotheca tamensis, Strain CCMP826" /LENGTH=547 /DNA_ID=CAMNT_0028397145 /DNA_START=117 /DNA_END=1760 /DNA_ORIENTATION=-